LTATTETHASLEDLPRRSAALSRVAFGGLVVALVLAFLLSLALGSVQIPLDQVVRVLAGGDAARDSWTKIVLTYRLPKALTAVLAGAALAVSGLQMQTFFRNPLADPSILGINAGASLGVAAVVLSAKTVAANTLLANLDVPGHLGLVASATIGAALVLVVVMVLARYVNTLTLLILGMMIGYLTNAVVSVLLYFSIADQVRAYVSWTFGSFASVTWRQMPVLAVASLVGLCLAFLLIKWLNAFLLGEGYAQSMGMPVRRARLWVVINSALLAGTVTAFCGPIGFLGVAVPHLCRALWGTADHRILIPASALMGAALALLADLAAQMPGSATVLPLNAITALLGAPVVIWVILRRTPMRAGGGW
jgi:iron complex transport system permease protein